MEEFGLLSSTFNFLNKVFNIVKSTDVDYSSDNKIHHNNILKTAHALRIASDTGENQLYSNKIVNSDGNTASATTATNAMTNRIKSNDDTS